MAAIVGSTPWAVNAALAAGSFRGSVPVWLHGVPAPGLDRDELAGGAGALAEAGTRALQLPDRGPRPFPRPLQPDRQPLPRRQRFAGGRRSRLVSPCLLAGLLAGTARAALGPGWPTGWPSPIDPTVASAPPPDSPSRLPGSTDTVSKRGGQVQRACP